MRQPPSALPRFGLPRLGLACAGIGAIVFPGHLFAEPLLHPAGRAPELPEERPAPEGVRDLAQLLPASTLVFVDLGGLAPILAAGLEHPLVATLLDSPFGQALQKQAPMDPTEALAWGDAFFGRPVLATLAQMTEAGFSFGFGLKRGQPTYLVAARGNDEGVTRDALERVLTLIAEENGTPPAALVQPMGEVRGFDTWFLGEDLCLATRSGLVLASNDEGTLRDAIDRWVDGTGANLTARDTFRRARRGASSESKEAAVLWSWVDIDALEALDPSATDELRELTRSPAAQFLFGPAIAAIGAARQTTAALRLGDDSIELTLAAVGLGGKTATMVLPPAADRVLGRDDKGIAADVLAGPLGSAARGYLYRDIEGLFTHRVELFPPTVLPQFAEATAGLALFFGGADISDEILPALSPWLELFVDELEFSAGTVPDLPLPGAALVAQVANASEVGPLLVGAFQTAIGIANVEGAQQMRPQLVMGLELVEGVTVTSAHYPPPAAGDGVDLRYNLEPACALVGERFIVGTHRDLVADLVRALSLMNEAPRHASALRRPDLEQLRIAGPVLARVLRANAEALALNAFLEEGKELTVARTEIETLALAGDLVRGITLETARPSLDRVHIALTLELAAR